METVILDAKGENEMERKEKKHPILMILAVGLVLIAAAVFAYFALRAKSTPKVPICADNTKNFGVFLLDLVRSMPPLNISGTSAGNREDPAYGDAA